MKKITSSILSGLIVASLLFLVFSEKVFAMSYQSPPVKFVSMWVGIIFFFLPFFFAVLLVEGLASYFYIRKLNLSRRVLRFVIIANLISYPVFLAAYAFLIFYPIESSIIVSIMFAGGLVIFEAFIIYIFNRKIISFKSSVILSLIINILSVILVILMMSVLAG